MKKIIFVSQALWLGGIETALVNLLNHLDYEKYDVTCLITEDYQEMAARITPQCKLLIADRNRTVSFSEPYRFARLFNLMEEPQNASRLRRLLWKALKLILRAPEAKLYSAYIRRQLKSEHFDTCVIYSDRVAEIAVRSIHADRFLMFYHNAELGRAYHDEFGYRRSEKIIAVSDAQCEKLKRMRPRYAAKMLAVQNYIDVESTRERSASLPEQPLFPHSGIHLVSCGRLARQKGFDIAVEACAQIVRSGFPQLHWYILGVGPERENLQALAARFGVGDHFHLLGAKQNPFPYMKAADIYVQPSRSEGYSLSILEARVLACPTVATYAAAGEQLIDGETGSLCDATASSVCEAIIRLLKNPSLSNRYRKALTEHSFEADNAAILARIEEYL